MNDDVYESMADQIRAADAAARRRIHRRRSHDTESQAQLQRVGDRRKEPHHRGGHGIRRGDGKKRGRQIIHPVAEGIAALASRRKKSRT